MLSRIIQQQIPLEATVVFVLKNGVEINGVLKEINENYLIIENDTEFITVLIDMIGLWRLSKLAAALLKNQSSDTSSAQNTFTTQTNQFSEIQPPQSNISVMQQSISATQPNSIDQVTELLPRQQDQEAIWKLFKIEARFNIHQPISSLPIKEPDFKFPGDELKSSSDALTIWSRVREKYQYAKKIDELTPKYGRIQQIMQDMVSLSVQYPYSSSVKRHLAYVYYLQGNAKEALKWYQSAAISADYVWDWYNLAALAFDSNQEDIACYSFGRFFQITPNTEAFQAWHVYARLVSKFSDYQSIREVLQKRLASTTEQERELWLETAIYLHHAKGNQLIAEELVKRWICQESIVLLINTAFEQLQGFPNEAYQKLVAQFRELEVISSAALTAELPRGIVDSYNSQTKIGFIKSDNNKYFQFDITAVFDDALREQLQNISSNRQISVVFEPSQGLQGPVAIKVMLYRTIEEMFQLAIKYAEDGEYHKAISVVKKVLEVNPNYPLAQEKLETWRKYARVYGIPKGSNPYARAKRAQQAEKDLEKAVRLYREAIEQKDNLESAVKDLAGLLAHLGRSDEAVQVLENYRNQISKQNQQSVDNMLIGFYQNVRQYDKAIKLLERKLNQVMQSSKKALVLEQLAMVYLKKEDFGSAEKQFRSLLQIQKGNIVAMRNLAFCLLKQGRYAEARENLERILQITPDVKAVELLDALKQAQTGQISSISIPETPSGFWQELSEFARFFLNISNHQVNDDHRQNFDQTDIVALEKSVEQSSTLLPRERAEQFLVVARIAFTQFSEANRFYKNLYRSFALLADTIVSEQSELDAAREYYSEALRLCNRDFDSPQVNPDTLLIKFLLLIVDSDNISGFSSTDDALAYVLANSSDRRKVFDLITYLIPRSQYAARRLLEPLCERPSLQAMTLEYFQAEGFDIQSIKQAQDFRVIWNELARRRLDSERTLRNDLRVLAHIEINDVSLLQAIQYIDRLSNAPFFELDRRRLSKIRSILNVALEMIEQIAFEEKEYLCLKAEEQCQDFLDSIMRFPTTISVEILYPLVENSIKKKIIQYRQLLYVESAPLLRLSIPIETYIPDSNRYIEVQVSVSNAVGCSPANDIVLVILNNEESFEVCLDRQRSLRGGYQHTQKIPIQLKEAQLTAHAFSFTVYARYRTLSNDIQETAKSQFTISLMPEDKFEEIDNPYSATAESGPVKNPNMFYGRNELIENLTRSLELSRDQSKCIVIYGQKRAGKSSILHHFKMRLSESKNWIVLDAEINQLSDPSSSISSPFARLLWSVLSKLKDAIEDKEWEGRSRLEISFPDENYFENHSSPLSLFRRTLELFRRKAARASDWGDVKIILLIDEFSYLYELIMKGIVPETFMKDWKSLLQEDLFSAVLVGQDFMPKFKQRFPNEFGVIQDERVTYLRAEDARKLIEDPIRIGGRNGESRYRGRAVERILELTAGSPFYIQMLCNRLVEYMNRKRASLVTEADVEQVKEEFIRGVRALTKDKFDNLINSGDTSPDAISDEDTLKVLGSIAEHSRTGPCSRSSIVCETTTPIDVILDDLVRRDVVERIRGQYYAIRVGLFKEWLLAQR